LLIGPPPLSSALSDSYEYFQTSTLPELPEVTDGARPTSSNQGRKIYEDERDRKLWLEMLGEVCAKTGWRIHAWVMMNNHYHLLLETPEANLVAGMKWLQGTYTQRYNSRHEVFGPLFQGRYKAVVEPEGGDYFAVVSTYIHLNPARAGLIRVETEVLAWWLCQHTTARRRWVSERLGMGDESRVTQAIGRVKRAGQPGLARLKRRLEQVYENNQREVEA
jgi:REP element-mobilizing transposase RayT